MRGRILGIDYGRKRIGLALSDETATIASPIGYILNKGAKKNIPAFRDLVIKHNIKSIMLGMPYHADGRESEMAAEVKSLGELLGAEFGLPVVYFDERYSTKCAEEHIRNNLGIRNPKKVAELIDTTAASMLLLEYIQRGENVR